MILCLATRRPNKLATCHPWGPVFDQRNINQLYKTLGNINEQLFYVNYQINKRRHYETRHSSYVIWGCIPWTCPQHSINVRQLMEQSESEGNDQICRAPAHNELFGTSLQASYCYLHLAASQKQTVPVFSGPWGNTSSDSWGSQTVGVSAGTPGWREKTQT